MWPEITKRLTNRLQARDYEDLLNRLGAYCRWVTARYNGPALPPGAKDRVASPHTTHSLNSSIWGIKPGIKMHGTGSEGHPLADAMTVNDIQDYPWPSADWFDYQGANEMAKRYHEHFVILGGFSPIFYLIADLCGMEKTLENIALDPDIILALVDRIEEFYTQYFSRIALTCKGNVDAIAFGDDFSGQIKMLMSPTHWRKFFKPAWTRLFSLVRDSGYKVMFHSCGSLVPVIPDLIEIGLDILYPLQPLATSMDINFLQKEFGRDLAFYGAIDVQDFMPHASEIQIEKEVSRIAQMFGAHGGYILSTSHVIMDDVPEDNVLTLYNAAKNIAFQSTRRSA